MHQVDGIDYRCTGLFYDWRPALGDFDKRAVLEIFRGASAPDAATLPDAVVVMMNPGSSAPLPGWGGREHEGERVPAKPDMVQYQVMRLMGAAGWNHVRVVNLADVRAAKSAELYARIAAGEGAAGLGAMFANASRVPVAEAVNAPVAVCAWGMDKRLAPFAVQAQAWLDARSVRVLGLRAPAAAFPAYRYPKPVGNWRMAVEWLDALKAQAAALPGRG